MEAWEWPGALDGGGCANQGAPSVAVKVEGAGIEGEGGR